MRYTFFWKNALVVAALMVLPQRVLAYIDPGTGSILLQGLLAGVAGLLVVMKLYWGRVKNFFSRNSSNCPSPEADNSPSPEAEPASKGPVDRQAAESRD